MRQIITQDLDKHFNYLRQCYEYAAKYSHDLSTKNAASLVDDSGNVLFIAANRIPEGIAVTPERLTVRPDKYFYITHAEAAVMFEAERKGFRDFRKVTMYCPFFACDRCANTIIEKTGLKGIIGHQAPLEWEAEIRKENGRNDWMKSIEAAWTMFTEREIPYAYLNGKIGGVENLHGERIFQP